MLKRPHKSWVFTYNNYKEEDIPVIAAWEDVAKMTVGQEVGKKTGTPHLQGAVTFKTAKRFSSVKKLNEKISWRVMAAKWNEGEAAFEYCRKDGIICIEIDNTVKRGKRSDLQKAYDAAKSGKTLKEWTTEEEPSYQAIKVYEKIKSVHDKRVLEDDKLHVIWIWGASGSGKSHAAREIGGEFCEFTGHRFVGGYNGEEVIMFDDIKPEDWTGCTHILLRLLDKYPYNMEVKNGYMKAMYHTVVITCLWKPEDFWGMVTKYEPPIQLLRRITEVRHMGDKMWSP